MAALDGGCVDVVGSGMVVGGLEVMEDVRWGRER
jgi:hypothetical protein